MALLPRKVVAEAQLGAHALIKRLVDPYIKGELHSCRLRAI